MKTIRLSTTLFLLVSLLISCNSKFQKKSKRLDSGSNLIIEELIEKNKKQQLFLSFWESMSENEFQKVKDYENRNGNLSNDRFIIKFSRFSDGKITEIPLKMNYGGDNVQLYLNDLRKDKLIRYLNDEFFPEYRSKYYDYKNLIEYIIEAFDQKYERIYLEQKTFNGENLIYWITDNNAGSKLITLEVYLYCIYFDVSLYTPTITDLKGIELKGEEVINYNWSDLLSEFEQRSTVLDFKIKIRYELYDSYQNKINENRKKYKIERKLEQERINKQKEIIERNKQLL